MLALPVVLVLLLAPSSPPQDRCLYELGAIEIVGTRERIQPPGTSQVSSSVLDSAAQASVAEALARQPGVCVSLGSKNEPQLFVWGMPQQRVLILSDGVVMASPYYGDVDLSQLPLEGIESIVLIKGSASVLSGPNALGGVLSLVSAKPGTRPHLRVVGSVDRDGGLLLRSSRGARVGPWYYQVGLGTRRSKGWRLSDQFVPFALDSLVVEDGGLRNNAHFRQWSAEGKCGLERDWGELVVSGSWLHSVKGIPPATSPLVRVRYWEFPRWDKTTWGLAGRVASSPAREARFNLFRHTFHNVLREYHDPKHTRLRYESTHRDASSGAMLRGSWILEHLTLRGALHALWEVHGVQPNLNEPWQRYRSVTGSSAVEVESHPHPRVGAVAGLAWEWYRFRGITGGQTDAELAALRASQVRAPALSSTLRIIPRVGHSLTLAASWRHRFPTMFQLFANLDKASPSQVRPLKPEHALQASVGYEVGAPGGLRGGLTLFRSRVRDLIDRPNRNALFDNIDRALYGGLEAWVGHHGRVLTSHVNATWIRAHSQDSLGTTRRLPRVPRFSLSAHLSYRLPWGTDVATSLTCRTHTVEYGDDGARRRVPGYTVADVALQHRILPGTTARLEVTNIADACAQQELGFPLPGRGIRLGVTYASP